ncbi:MAG: primary-amine oxidase [Microcystis panniformis Mp_MB_F_20051200_S9]|uniref:Amine oxidase n=1 Tax=Microcystis panniformis Mp_MB_F_20051200_S9 TaxID=2486223 RepID=A0A552PRU3_9CHRO|nr:MAG: primary-amine oxidase [Microcystis panniformis Mp_GB_SS_20050300_S99]TRV49778.1 MAG: primary-amine oxidase [Microcystis panniformis Mp_MB_F_20080800_S26D]TRV55096.1 MAG: primary-amine oxidase [Microcystis panniformis Mp_GB_SS_20050300_S99D]TRV56754.1 MAG: primary-amine oxidase [Microcystis panniformis Mp_MB_F_20051200_S9D]TRV57874.1 MAG: primary-amine oxidase [Microcystis panniformis Mp_MB_F_20080800_S26]TRV59707.1 MAG: primary-amine oxidase [Microcystis panniformis Mp_MB_F_20051200_S9
MLKKYPWWRPLTILFVISCGVILIFGKTFAQSPGISHPLDPLTENEIKMAVTVVKKDKSLTEFARFPNISLQEPDKQTVLNFKKADAIPRQAFLVILEPRVNKTYEAIVDTKASKILSWQEVSTGQPPLLDEEYEILDQLAKADLRWQEAMKKRGITDFENVIIDGWATGMVSEKEQASGKRLIRGITYYKGKDRNNYYGAPIEGLSVTVDLNNRQVFEVRDTGIVPFSKANFDYDEKTLSPLQKDLKPLRIRQPQGTTFQIKGNEVSWQNWKFRYLMHPREGLVLYLVTYNDNGKDRMILYRAGLSEMLVPYSNTSREWAVRSAFDVGEYRFGWLSTPLDKGNDVPENTVLLNALFADDNGEPYIGKNLIGIYEKDAGILWRHYDFNTETFEGRRARQLVVNTVAAIGNYDYGINWIFHEDGTLEQRSDLTGIMLAKATHDVTNAHNHGDQFGTLVAANVEAINHQHFLNFRLDFDVDGVKNSVTEMKVSTLSPEKNTFGNAFTMSERNLPQESEAIRDVNLAESRAWMIMNKNQKNSLGMPTSYMLMPSANSIYYPNFQADSRQRGEFATHHFWATRYKANELYAAGDYPNQGKKGRGLPQYTADNESLDNEDLVVWYTYGVTHIPRPEEWPIMTVHPAGFKIMSWGFFDQNPVLNVPKNNLEDSLN